MWHHVVAHDVDIRRAPVVRDIVRTHRLRLGLAQDELAANEPLRSFGMRSSTSPA
jgi:hypothetical protein